MARNTVGTYALPQFGNPVSGGTTILASVYNGNNNDISDALTDSLSRSGNGGMNAPLKHVDGTANLPGVCFGSEPTSGLYRAGAKDLRFAFDGTEGLRVTNAAVTVPSSNAFTALGAVTLGTTSFTTKLTLTGVANNASASGLAFYATSADGSEIGFTPSTQVGGFNDSTQAGDAVLFFGGAGASTGTLGTGRLVIAGHKASGTPSGVVIDNAANTVRVRSPNGLIVDGPSTITGNVTAAGTLSVTGLATFTAGADMTGDKIVNVAAGTASTDAVNKGQMDAAAAAAAAKITQVLSTAINFALSGGTAPEGSDFAPCWIWNAGAGNTTIGLSWVAPVPGTLSLFRYHGTATITDSGTPYPHVFTVKVNGAATSLTVSPTTGDTNTVDAAHQVSVSAGDLITYNYTQIHIGTNTNGPSVLSCVFRET